MRNMSILFYFTIFITNVVFVFQGESPFSSIYIESKQRSQIIGLSLACVIPLAIFVVYFSVKACSPMTYHQEKINSKCKKKLEEMLVDEFEKAVDKPVSSVVLRLDKMSKLL